MREAAGDILRTHHHFDGDVGGGAYGSIGVGGDSCGEDSVATALFERSDNIRGSARRSDADNSIARVDIERLQVFPALVGVVLGIFNGVAQGVVAAGYEADHPRGIHAECGRNLRSVEHAEAPRCAGSHVEDAAAAFHTGHDFGDEFFNLRE